VNVDTTNELKAPTRPVASVRRLRLLVGAHLALTSVLLGYRFIPGEVTYLPLLNAIGSVSLAQALVLSFWLGMGTSGAIRRIIGGVLGVLYVCAWQLIAFPVSGDPLSDLLSNFLNSLLQFGLLLGLFGGGFLAVRRWVAHLQYRETFDDQRPRRAQFSILHLLLVTTIAALVLGLARGSRGTTNQFDWSYIALMALCFVIFFVNTLCAVWAALALGPVRWRVMLVFLIALLLGLALLMPMYPPNYPPSSPQLPWWLGPSQVVVTLVPIGIVVVSLLVVRSCGYRLVPNRQPR